MSEKTDDETQQEIDDMKIVMGFEARERWSKVIDELKERVRVLEEENESLRSEVRSLQGRSQALPRSEG